MSPNSLNDILLHDEGVAATKGCLSKVRRTMPGSGQAAEMGEEGRDV